MRFKHVFKEFLELKEANEKKMTVMRSDLLQLQSDKEEKDQMIKELQQKLESVNLQKSTAGNAIDAQKIEDLLRDAAFRFGQQFAGQMPQFGGGYTGSRGSFSGPYQRSQQSSSASQSNYSMSSFRTMSRGMKGFCIIRIIT